MYSEDSYDHILAEVKMNRTPTLQDWEQKKKTLQSNRSHRYSADEMEIRAMVITNIRTGWRNRKCLYEQVKAEKMDIARIMAIMLAKGELLPESSPHPTKRFDSATIYRLSKKVMDEFGLLAESAPSCRALAKALGVSKNTINRLRNLDLSDYEIRRVVQDCPHGRYLHHAKKREEQQTSNEIDTMSIRELSRATGHSYSKIQNWLKSGKTKSEIAQMSHPNQIGDGDAF